MSVKYEAELQCVPDQLAVMRRRVVARLADVKYSCACNLAIDLGIHRVEFIRPVIQSLMDDGVVKQSIDKHDERQYAEHQMMYELA